MSRTQRQRKTQTYSCPCPGPREPLYDRCISQRLELDGHVEAMAKWDAFITLKDHKSNFEDTSVLAYQPLLLQPCSCVFIMWSLAILSLLCLCLQGANNLNCSPREVCPGLDVTQPSQSCPTGYIELADESMGRCCNRCIEGKSSTMFPVCVRSQLLTQNLSLMPCLPFSPTSKSADSYQSGDYISKSEDRYF